MEQLEVQLELQQMLVYELVSEFAEEFEGICKKWTNPLLATNWAD